MQIGLALSTATMSGCATGISVPAAGTAPAVPDGQSWTVDDDSISLDGSASGAKLTFSYAASGLPAGLDIDSGTGAITGTPTSASTGTATVTATDQYGRMLEDTFTWSTQLRAQATGGTDLDLSFPQDSAISSTDLVQNWTDNGNTLTFVSVSPSLPTGLSIDSSGTMTGTPTTVTADATYTLTMEDEYGRETSDTFTLETVAGDTTAPTVTITAGTQQSDGSLELTFTDLTEDGTMGIVWTSSDQSAVSASAVRAAAEGDTALTDQLSVETQAVTVGGGPYTVTDGLPSGQDETVYYQIVLWDSAGNISSVSSGSVTLDTTDPTVSTLSPADGATDVAVNENIVMTFSEAMKQQGTVTLKNVGGATIETFDLSTDGTWSSGDTVWTGNPASDFTNSASLAVQWSGLEDTKGNALANNSIDTTWSFDVAAAASSLQIKATGTGQTYGSTTTIQTDAAVAGDMIVVFASRFSDPEANFTIADFTTDNTNLYISGDRNSTHLFYQKITSDAPGGVDIAMPTDCYLRWFNLGNCDFFGGGANAQGGGSGQTSCPVISSVPANSLIVYGHARRAGTAVTSITGHGQTLSNPASFPVDDGEWKNGETYAVDIVQHGASAGDCFGSVVVDFSGTYTNHRGAITAAFSPS